MSEDGNDSWENMVDAAQGEDPAAGRYRSHYHKNNTVPRSIAPQNRPESLLRRMTDSDDLLRTETTAISREEAVRLCNAYAPKLREASTHLAELIIALDIFDPTLKHQLSSSDNLHLKSAPEYPGADDLSKLLNASLDLQQKSSSGGKKKPKNEHIDSVTQILGPLRHEAAQLGAMLRNIYLDITTFAEHVRTSAGRKGFEGKDVGAASELEPMIDKVSTLLNLSSTFFDTGLVQIGEASQDSASSKGAGLKPVQDAVAKAKGGVANLHQFIKDLREVESDAGIMKLGGTKAEEVLKRIGIEQRKGGIGIAGPSTPAGPALPPPEK